MTLYIGVDFHPHQQTLAWCDTQTGETDTCTLQHNLSEVFKFYQSVSPSVVGIEASSRAVWFEQLLEETNHQLLVGNPALIRARARSRHKSDNRDAQLILDLLVKDEFPAIWRRSQASNQVIDVLHLRRQLVNQRTQTYNRLQALAHSGGLPKGKMKTLGFQSLLKAVPMNESGQMQREHLFSLLEQLTKQIRELQSWLNRKASSDKQVQLLLTQRGVGYLTALAMVHTLGDVSRFEKVSKQVIAFAGLDSLEKSSAGKTRFGRISKAGSPLLRGLLGQSANIVIRYDTRLKAFYKGLAKRKPIAVAKTATARKLLVKLAIMLRDNITADEFDRRGVTVGNARFLTRSEMTVG
ncbi:MAG: IS110 family transposase [Acidobacteria bacterium]|nr:IS110 family transposase [Acidobacteriota bacterium]